MDDDRRVLIERADVPPEAYGSIQDPLPRVDLLPPDEIVDDNEPDENLMFERRDSFGHYRVHKRRWYILTIYWMLSFMQVCSLLFGSGSLFLLYSFRLPFGIHFPQSLSQWRNRLI